MNTTFFALCFLFATAAFGQTMPSMTSTFQVGSHAYHAGPHSVAGEGSILGGNGVFTGHGEMPLADIPVPEVPETPLGDVARQFRQERLYGKKAAKIWENPVYGTKPVVVAQ